MKKIVSIEITEECYLHFQGGLYMMNSGDRVRIGNPSEPGAAIWPMDAQHLLVAGQAEVGETADCPTRPDLPWSDTEED